LFYGLAGARARVAFKKNGMEFIEVPEAEIARWKEKLKGIESQFIQKMQSLGYPSDALIQAIHDSSNHYATMSADELMQEALDHPFTNITPLDNHA
jgi:predicted secreted protein